MSTKPQPRRLITQDGEDCLNKFAHELEQIAEEIRGRGMRGHIWQELKPQFERLRELEKGIRWMIEP